MVTGSPTTGTRTLLRGVVVVGAGSLTEGLGGKQLGEAPEKVSTRQINELEYC
jgi:hypothetical protein